MEDHSSFGSDNYSAAPPSLLGMALITMSTRHATHTIIRGLSEHPPSGLQSYNAAAPSSKTEAYPADNPEVDSLIEDNILKNAIPVVRDVVCISSRLYVVIKFIENNLSFKELQRGLTHICRKTTLLSKSVLSATL
jgi:hypothetical protein